MQPGLRTCAWGGETPREPAHAIRRKKTAFAHAIRLTASWRNCRQPSHDAGHKARPCCEEPWVQGPRIRIPSTEIRPFPCRRPWGMMPAWAHGPLRHAAAVLGARVSHEGLAIVLDEHRRKTHADRSAGLYRRPVGPARRLGDFCVALS